MLNKTSFDMKNVTKTPKRFKEMGKTIRKNSLASRKYI